jgi:DNA replication and repair protein RecF
VIRRLRLFQFRCHAELVWEPAAGRQVLTGANGQGKTSLLEAIYFLSRLKSFRARQIRELCAWGQAEFRVEADWSGQVYQVTWSGGQRVCKIDGQVTGAAEFWGRWPCVLFALEDRELISGPARLRREWVDSLLAHQAADYLTLALRYREILRQRNAWLQQGAPDLRLGRIWEEQLVTLGREIMTRRQTLTGEIRKRWIELMQPILRDNQEIDLSYQPSWTEGTRIDWENLRPREIKWRQTLTGPHRDDWSLRHQSKSLGRFGSEGQQRLAALCLRLVETGLMEKWRNQQPVLLMDDVVGALDARRQEALWAQLPIGAQSFETRPEPPAKKTVDLWRIEPGSCRPV